MLHHKFRMGQAVTLVGHESEDRYRIVRFLPVEGNMLQYRIKNNIDGYQWDMQEHELGSVNTVDTTV